MLLNIGQMVEGYMRNSFLTRCGHALPLIRPRIGVVVAQNCGDRIGAEMPALRPVCAPASAAAGEVQGPCLYCTISLQPVVS